MRTPRAPMRTRFPLPAITSAALSPLLLALLFSAPARAIEIVWSCGGGYPDNVFTHSTEAGISAHSRCSVSSGGPGNPAFGGNMILRTTGVTVTSGKGAHWAATAPPGFIITAATIPSGALSVAGVNSGQTYRGRFFWKGGSRRVHDGESSSFIGPFVSRYFGWALACDHQPVCRSDTSKLDVGDIALNVDETTPPQLIAPTGLWRTTGWIRGTWPLYFYGTSAAGMCGLSARIGGLEVASSSSSRNQSLWHQCGSPAINQSIDTKHLGQGPLSLALAGWDAADELAGVSRTIYVDNSQPSVSLSGPTEASSSAGAQYLTAAASGGPSGIMGLTCSIDSGPQTWYPGISARVAVSGVGEHVVVCSAENNATDPAGNHAWSSPARWAIAIRQPTVTTIGFENVINAVECSRVSERQVVPAHWVTLRRGGRLVLVKRPAYTKIVEVSECHPRTKLERVPVWVTIRRDGKPVRVRRTKLLEVVLPPHVVESSMRRVRYGRWTTINGWLGTSAGVGLGGKRITLLTAAENGEYHFRPARTVVTNTNGSWSAPLRPGPSRLVEAIYKGGSTTEPSTSTRATMVVPAAIRLRIEPKHTHWGGTIRIVGQLLGGFIPTPGETVYIHVAVRGLCCDIIHLTSSRGGSFRYSYTFDGGSGTYKYRFWAGSVGEADYPFAANRSKVLTVTVR
jgi:hypothetical protein